MFDYLSVLSKCELDQRLHGLSGVEIDYSWSGWPLSGFESRMESSASKDLPPNQRGFSPFLSPLSIFRLFFPFFW